MDLEMRGWDICRLFQAGFKIIKDENSSSSHILHYAHYMCPLLKTALNHLFE